MDITTMVKEWLSGITPVNKAKLFFFSTHANTPSSMRSSQNVEETQFPLAYADAVKIFSKIDEYLEKKAMAFFHHNVTEKTISETDYQCLSFFSACEYLHFFPPFLGLEKVASIQDNFEMTDEERDYRLLLNSADLVLEKVCDSLKPAGVTQIWTALIKDSPIKDISYFIDINPIGMKECLFFFIVRHLQMLNMLNRVSTNKLERFITACEQNSACEEGKTLDSIIECLRCYPVEKPFGFCLILSVHTNRDGASRETDNVLDISKHLGMISHKVLNPTEETIDKLKNELVKPKYRFYSSFTCWFMAHGGRESMEFADGNSIERKEFLKIFSHIESFLMKPKVFFMVSCLGSTKFKPRDQRNECTTVKGDNALEISDSVQNICETQPMMDTLVAYSTLPDNVSGRNITHGSLYVDRAHHLLMSKIRSNGRNLTEILEHLSQELHDILQVEDNGGSVYKHGCHFTSYFRKTLKLSVPR